MKKLKQFFAVLLVFMTCVGCTSANVSKPAIAGQIFLKVNPEVELQLDEQGNVTKLLAKNEEAKAIVENITYKNKSAAPVLIDVLTKIHAKGYLENRDKDDIQVRFKGDMFDKDTQVSIRSSLCEYASLLKTRDQDRIHQTAPVAPAPTPVVENSVAQPVQPAVNTPVQDRLVTRQRDCQPHCCLENCQDPTLHHVNCVNYPNNHHENKTYKQEHHRNHH